MKTRRAFAHEKGPHVVYVGRLSLLGNPFIIGPDGTRDEVCDKYEARFAKLIAREAYFKAAVEKCRGKALRCWCKENERCHADTIVNFLERA